MQLGAYGTGRALRFGYLTFVMLVALSIVVRPGVAVEYANQYLPPECTNEKEYFERGDGTTVSGPYGEYYELVVEVDHALYKLENVAHDGTAWLAQLNSRRSGRRQANVKKYLKRVQRRLDRLYDKLAYRASWWYQEVSSSCEGKGEEEFFCIVMDCSSDPDGRDCATHDLTSANQMFNTYLAKLSATTKAVLRKCNKLTAGKRHNEKLKRLKTRAADWEQKAQAAMQQLPARAAKSSYCVSK